MASVCSRFQWAALAGCLLLGASSSEAQLPIHQVLMLHSFNRGNLVIDNFTGSCESAGSSATFCGCVIDALQQDVPYDRFVEIDQQLAEDPSNIPSELTDAAEGCQ